MEMANNKETFERLCDDLMKQVEDILNNEVSQVAVEIQKENIDKEVYGAYKPIRYKRRKNRAGGLRWGARAMKVVSPKKRQTTVSIYNKSSPNMSEDGYTFKNLPFLIEYGHRSSGYVYDFTYNRKRTSYKYKQARPFMQRTYEEFERTNVIEKTLANGLRRLGYKVNERMR